MQLLIDLRYTCPPLLNLFSFLPLTSQNKPAFLLAAFLTDQPISIFMLAFLLVATFLTLLFLFFSAELHLTPHPISLRARGFSIALFISLVAAGFLPPSLFWLVYLFILITAPWHDKLFDLFIRFFRCFALTLQSLPTFMINVTQNHENPDPSSPQVVDLEVGTVAIEGERQPLRSQQSSEPDCNRDVIVTARGFVPQQGVSSGTMWPEDLRT
ncbi:hypothetical protein QQP08_012109 [Theobroma cacao]|nr:hypothetical protein QQP08_012109 [Theobroma cacao]